jgi:hypothetical protein
MKLLPLLRFVPKPLTRFRFFPPPQPPPLPGAGRPAENYESVRYVPVWIGTQLMPFPIVTRERRTAEREEWF